VTGQIAGWAPIAGEQVSGGYQVVWKANGADQYTIWTTDSSGNFVSYISAMPGSSSVLKTAESTFQQDLNGDGQIGNGLIGNPNVIESAGVTSLTQVGSNYYLYNSGVGPQLKYNGAAVVEGQIAGWAPIAGEQVSGGYQVVWKANGADQYTIWTTDGSGNFVSFISAMPGSSSVLQSAESTFQQDLNSDGVVGLHAAPLSAAVASILNTNPASQANGFQSLDGDSFLFASDLGASVTSAAGTATPVPAAGSELVMLLQAAQSQQAIQWASQLDALVAGDHFDGAVPTKAEMAYLNANGFIFH
jgi:serralysin